MADKHVKRCSTLSAIKEMSKPEPQGGAPFQNTSVVLIRKTATRVGEDEDGTLTQLLVGIKNGGDCQNSLAVPQNSYMVTIQPRNSTSKYKPRTEHRQPHRSFYMNIHSISIH